MLNLLSLLHPSLISSEIPPPLLQISPSRPSDVHWAVVDVINGPWPWAPRGPQASEMEALIMQGPVCHIGHYEGEAGAGVAD